MKTKIYLKYLKGNKSRTKRKNKRKTKRYKGG